MNCTEFESILADYIDGTLGDAQRAAVDQHAAECSVCAEFMADVTGAARFLKRADDVEPPPELITRIAFQAPQGRLRSPHERRGLLSSLAGKWFQPLLQPRLAMGMAMTLLSFAMLERCTGIHVQHIQAADLNPVRVWDGIEDKAMRMKDRVVKSYENLRVVYEVETRLKDMQQEQDARATAPQRQSSQTPPKQSAPDQRSKK